MNKKIFKKLMPLLLTLLLSFSLISCSGDLLENKNETSTSKENFNNNEEEGNEASDRNNDIEEDGYYTGKEEVALYIQTYDKLPANYISKKEARDLGWESSQGNLWEVTDRMSIGGDRFGNREGLLEDKEGRQYFECDINYDGGYRGPERLVYSNDGLIYYTADHYESFELIYESKWLKIN